MTAPSTQIRDAAAAAAAASVRTERPDRTEPDGGTEPREADGRARTRRGGTPRRSLGVGAIWLRVVAVTIATTFLVAWAGLTALGSLTERETAVELWELGLRPPTELSIALAMIEHETDGGRYLVADQDLVGFVLTPEEVRADLSAVIERIVVSRSEQLYEDGPPADPGAARRSFTGVPRTLLAQLTAERHEQVPAATTAALVGLGAGVLVALASGGIATALSLTGLSSLLAWGVVSAQVRLVRALVDSSSPIGAVFADAIGSATRDPLELLLFTGIALIAAGIVYRWLAPSTTPR
jgi:hypothetical protein